MLTNRAKPARHLDLACLQPLRNKFVALTGIPAVIVDTGGQALTLHGHGGKFCDLMLEYAPTAHVCREAMREMCNAGYKRGEPAVFACPYTGYTLVSAPITVDGAWMGNWIVGQLRVKGFSEEHADGSGEIGQEHSRRLQALLDELPVMEKKEFDRMLLLLRTFCRASAEADALPAKLCGPTDSEDAFTYICNRISGKPDMPGPYGSGPDVLRSEGEQIEKSCENGRTAEEGKRVHG